MIGVDVNPGFALKWLRVEDGSGPWHILTGYGAHVRCGALHLGRVVLASQNPPDDDEQCAACWIALGESVRGQDEGSSMDRFRDMSGVLRIGIVRDEFPVVEGVGVMTWDPEADIVDRLIQAVRNEVDCEWDQDARFPEELPELRERVEDLARSIRRQIDRQIQNTAAIRVEHREGSGLDAMVENAIQDLVRITVAAVVRQATPRAVEDAADRLRGEIRSFLAETAERSILGGTADDPS